MPSHPLKILKPPHKAYSCTNYKCYTSQPNPLTHPLNPLHKLTTLQSVTSFHSILSFIVVSFLPRFFPTSYNLIPEPEPPTRVSLRLGRQVDAPNHAAVPIKSFYNSSIVLAHLEMVQILRTRNSIN
jgi:hypothetical protein